MPSATDSSVRQGRRLRWRLLIILMSVLILTLGLTEDLYGNTDSGDVYGSDAVQYLDIARAIGHHDWHSALNPLWSQGYPAVLAAARPLFPAGPAGDWDDTRTVNFVIFCADYAAFLFMLFGLVSEDETPGVLLLAAAGTLFLATQVCLGQVSRVNPDELVSTCLFLACGLAVRLLCRREHAWRHTLLLGATLGLGFLFKAILLPVGCVLLFFTGIALILRRRSVLPLAAAAALIALTAGVYGSALSRATGYRTLGDSGALNYAWHVDRLHKWVHWQGGLDPASEAWPRPSIARFAQWDSDPPDFGLPVHPTRILQREPTVYGFVAPFHATYTPYYDPAYFYQGYRPVKRWRYQVIAVFKSLGDLAQTLAHQPALLFAAGALVVLLLSPVARLRLLRSVTTNGVIILTAVASVLIYLPVHLEGRYLASFFAAGLLALFAAAAHSSAASRRGHVTLALLAVGLLGDLALTQLPVWRNLLHHESPARNEEWQIGEAVLAQHLPVGAPVADLSWTANLHSDWAYIGHVEIVAEIASPGDLKIFWEGDQQRTLATLREAGAVAVFSRDKPVRCACAGWTRLGATPMWLLRLR